MLNVHLIIIIMIIINLIYIAQFVLTVSSALHIVITYIQMQYVHI